MRRGYIDIEVE